MKKRIEEHMKETNEENHEEICEKSRKSMNSLSSSRDDHRKNEINSPRTKKLYYSV